MIATYLSDDNDHIIEESDEDDDMDKKPNSNYKVLHSSNLFIHYRSS